MDSLVSAESAIKHLRAPRAFGLYWRQAPMRGSGRGVKTYSEPTVLWTLRHADGRVARATFIPGAPLSTLVWVVDDTLDRAENFDDWDQALARAESTRLTLLEEGWRGVEEG